MKWNWKIHLHSSKHTNKSQTANILFVFFFAYFSLAYTKRNQFWLVLRKKEAYIQKLFVRMLAAWLAGWLTNLLYSSRRVQLIKTVMFFGLQCTTVSHFSVLCSHLRIRCTINMYECEREWVYMDLFVLHLFILHMGLAFDSESCLFFHQLFFLAECKANQQNKYERERENYLTTS